MIERYLIRALKKGIAELVETPSRINVIFECMGLDSTEAAKAREYFEAKPPSVIHQYPRSDSEFPLFCVVLGAESEAQKFLNNFGGFAGEYIGSDIGPNTLFRTSIYQHTHHVLTYTDHPDVTIYYYTLAKYFITREQDWLQDRGVLDLALSGADMGPDEAYTPEWLFVRRLTISTRSEERVFDETYPTITAVEGLHIEPAEGVIGEIEAYTEVDVDLPPILGSE